MQSVPSRNRVNMTSDSCFANFVPIVWPKGRFLFRSPRYVAFKRAIYLTLLFSMVLDLVLITTELTLIHQDKNATLTEREVKYTTFNSTLSFLISLVSSTLTCYAVYREKPKVIVSISCFQLVTSLALFLIAEIKLWMLWKLATFDSILSALSIAFAIATSVSNVLAPNASNLSTSHRPATSITSVSQTV